MKKRKFAWAATAARVVAALVATLILVQGALAGSHLTGAPGALGVHEMIGTVVISTLALIMILLGAMALTISRWLPVLAVTGFVGIWVQLMLGFSDRVEVHIPLGIALFGLYLGIAAWRPDRRENS